MQVVSQHPKRSVLDFVIVSEMQEDEGGGGRRSFHYRNYFIDKDNYADLLGFYAQAEEI